MLINQIWVKAAGISFERSGFHSVGARYTLAPTEVYRAPTEWKPQPVWHVRSVGNA